MKSDKRAARVGGAFRYCAVLFCLVLITHHSSLITASGQPAFFEKDHYYKAKGVGVAVRWEVPVTSVEDGRELAATLVVSRAANPTEVVRPDLKALPAFADRFTVTDVPGPPSAADAKEVRFAYRLSPRNRKVDRVPALEFAYFNTAAAPGKSPFRKTQADSVPITVTEPPKTLKKAEPLVEADHLFHVATGPEVLRGPFVPCRWAWGAAALFGPLAAVGWFLVWRRIYPDAARAARLRRSRAARRATDAIRRSGRAPDPPAVVASAVLGYLRTRFPLPESAVTPSEIAAALGEAKVPADVAEGVADVFRECDRARFAPPGDSGAAIAADAETAIARLEALA